jgi:mannosyltransferase OCH1-like enzyme
MLSLINHETKTIDINRLREKLSKVYNNKSSYNSIIPLKIFQTWHTKKLPVRMAQSVNSIKANNPRFQHYLFDDNDCREFIKENFLPNVLEAFDSLIPGAYKADLWRYCVLYKEGGIYLDIKYRSHNKFKFINLTEKEHFVLDADNNGIYNALMVCMPRNEILLKAINQIVTNVKNRYYGLNCLSPTGPKLLSQFFSNYEKNQLDMKHGTFQSHKYITYNNVIAIKMYNKYYEDMSRFQKNAHYSVLWGKRKIYK